MHEASIDQSENAVVMREVSFQLSETVCDQLEVISKAAGASQTVLVEAALQHFLKRAIEVNYPIGERLERIDSQLESLENEIRIVAETVLLHARHYLTVSSAVEQPQLRGANDCRADIRADRADSQSELKHSARTGPPVAFDTRRGEEASRRDGTQVWHPSGKRQPDQTRHPAVALSQRGEGSAAVQEDGSNPNFRYLPNASC
jgi:hypothetical protein